MNKKGMFYFFVAIVVLFSISLLFFLNTSKQFTESKEVVKSRIHTMDTFIENLNNDIEKAMYIAAYRGLIAMEEEISTQGAYFNDSGKVFKEAFYNGTIDGENKTVLNSSSFSDYLQSVNITADEIGVNLNINVENISLYHKDPWHVTVKIEFLIHLQDRRGLASWEFTKVKETQVPVTNLRDPVYTVGSNGKFPNVIEKTNITRFINDTNNANDTTNLMLHTNNSFYIQSDQAPSYAMRLEGNFNSSPNGIESLVDIDELQSQGLSVKTDRSIVDHVYFQNNVSGYNLCDNVINTPTWFKIDENHTETYEIDPKLNPDGYQC